METSVILARRETEGVLSPLPPTSPQKQAAAAAQERRHAAMRERDKPELVNENPCAVADIEMDAKQSVELEATSRC